MGFRHRATSALFGYGLGFRYKAVFAMTWI